MPSRLLDLASDDLGYASAVQPPDDRLLTAYYAKSGPGHEGYHMGVVVRRAAGAD